MLLVRLAFCPRCKRMFAICRSCDHGRVYCCHECSSWCRNASCRRARKRYRKSERGRMNHRQCERRRRKRLRALALQIFSPTDDFVGDHGTITPVIHGTQPLQSISDGSETNDCEEDECNENETLETISECNVSSLRCAICGRIGQRVSLAATGGWWPRRPYRPQR